MSHPYPEINYNSSTGSSTNPSDCVASSVGTSVTAGGTASGTTITFDFAESELESLDLSACADDDTDFIWVNTASGDRHLFQITAFTGGKSACTAVTVAESISATFSATAWHINGTRDDLDPDNSNGEYKDWGRGWTAVLDGSFTLGNNFHPGGNLSSSNNTVSDPPITIKASASASSKPTITGPSWSKMMEIDSYIMVKCIGIKLSRTGSEGGSLSFVNVNEGALTMIDCDIVNTSTTQPGSLFEAVATNRALRMFNCYVTGGSTRMVRSAFNSHILLDNCVFDGDDTYGSESALLLEGEDNVVTNCLITETVGAGIRFEVDGTAGQTGFWMVKNCTIADCGGDGIELVGTPTATDKPTHTFAIVNTISANNGGYGFDLPETNVHVNTGDIDYNCVFNNTSGGYNGATPGPNDITITTDPFTDAANDDYTLNNTSTGGALLRDAARYTLPDGT